LYTVTIEASFKASHQLTFNNGKTEDRHDHDWHLKVGVQTEDLDENGLAVDFIYLNEKIEKITGLLDNTELENLEFFQDINASAENVAKHVFDQLIPQIPPYSELAFVEVMEAPGCWAKYSR